MNKTENSDSNNPAAPGDLARESGWSTIPESLRRGMRAAIVGSCFKVVSSQSFSNGLMLVFLSALSLDGATVLFLLSLVNVLLAFCLIPCAHLADCFGKRRITLAGIALCGAGFALLPMVGLFPARMTLAVLAVGIGLYGIGSAAQVASWYALLAPIVPVSYRGRFFGALRVSWQVCGVALTALIAFVLPAETSIRLLKIVLMVSGLSIIPWGIYYSRIPELEREPCTTRGLPDALRKIVHFEGYLPFCAYLFIINLFVGGCPVLFGLVEKRVLQLGDDIVVLLATITMIGSVAGFYVGGKAVDRVGTKPVFLVCHFGYGLSLASFVLRSAMPCPSFMVLSIVHVMFGGLMAAGSIAFSTEMLALIPAARKSLSTSIVTTMIQAGVALSGLLGAWGMKLGLFSDSWMLAGSPRSSYDAVLLVYAVMIVLMTVTLGLIPSVVGRPELRGGPHVT